MERAIWALSEVTALFAALRLRQPKLQVNVYRLDHLVRTLCANLCSKEVLNACLLGQVHICDGDMDAASKQDAALLIEAKALVFTNSPTPPAPPGCQLDPADLGDRDPGLAGDVAKTPSS